MGTGAPTLCAHSNALFKSLICKSTLNPGSTLSSIIIGTLAFITVEPASPPFIASNTHSGSTPAFFARMKLSETAWILHATII